MLYVVKSNGQRELYSEEKLRKSMKRSGVSEKHIDEVAQEIKSRLYEGITTRELFHIVKHLLKGKDVCSRCRYNLRSALQRFGPAGYNFEKYIASVLQAYEYEAHNPQQDLKGRCVYHEVDVMAKKGKITCFIEAKFRNSFSDNVNLKDTMATWARYLDLNEGKEHHFDEAWIVTNARFSDRATAFGECHGMKLIGWSYPKDQPLEKMVDHAKIYPVTVLDLAKKDIDILAANDIMLCQQLETYSVKDLSKLLSRKEERVQEIHDLCRQLAES